MLSYLQPKTQVAFRDPHLQSCVACRAQVRGVRPALAICSCVPPLATTLSTDRPDPGSAGRSAIETKANGA
jgi:hypothetical protein